MIKMKRKAISLVLAMLIILASFPLTAFAAEGDRVITKVDLTATKPLMEYYDGHYNEDEGYFVYYIESTEPTALVTYSDNTTEKILWDDFWNIFYGFNAKIEQGAGDKQLVAGKTYTTDVELTCENGDETYFVNTEIEFTIEKNPIKSVSAQGEKDLVKEVSGSWENIYDENGNVTSKYFCYDLSNSEFIVTVTFTDGEVFTGTESALCDETGYSIGIDHDQQDKPFSLGENTATISCLGIKGKLNFTIIEDPVKSITVTEKKSLIQNNDGSWSPIDYDDESKGKWFCYALRETKPEIVVEYTNGETIKCNYDDCYDLFGEDVEFIYDQSPENQLTVGTYTGKAKLLGHECDFTFRIIENPIKSISINVADKLEEHKSGYWEDIYDDDTGEVIGEYYYYDLDNNTTTITINYTDTSKESETYTLSELSDAFKDSSLNIDLGQSAENPLKPGKYTTGKAEFMGVSCTFSFEISEDPIKSISARATADLIENLNCNINGESEGEPYVHYIIDETYPELTITYSDGTEKTYSYYEISKLPGYFWIECEQSATNQLKPGTHTATIEYEGKRCEFTFRILEDPIKSISVKPTKDLVENIQGRFLETEEGSFFYYDLKCLEPEFTITYKDGTEKTYDSESFYRYTEYFYTYDLDQFETPLKPGEHTTKMVMGSRKIDYKFNIVKQNSSQKVKSLVVKPENTIIENTCGFMDSEYDEINDKALYYYYYYPENSTFTVTVTFEDGTTKTYKNVKNGDELDNSALTVYFNQSYNNQFKVGKNTATAYYRNAKCDFQIEIVKNDYTAVNISGDKELVLTFTKADGKKDTFKAQFFEVKAGDDTTRYGLLKTDKGILDVEVTFNISKDGTSFENIQLKIFEDDKALKSNVLKSNEWFDMIAFAGQIDLLAAIYADGYSQRFFNREFTGLNGDFTGAKVDDILTICTGDADFNDYKNKGEDEKGYFVILTLEEAEDLVSNYFDVSKIDFTSSPMYNAGPKEIKVYFMRWFGGQTKNQMLEDKNGKFIFNSDYEASFTNDSYPVTVALDSSGYVDSISFVKGPCGNVKTVEAKNAEGGVNITFTAAENATEYEIYRSLNGAAFEKIGTTSGTAYLDKTAVSGKTYTYKVLPKNANSQGGYSAGKTVTYLAMPVTTVAISKTGFTVKWTKVSGAAQYRIYRAENVNGKWSNWETLCYQKASVSAYADKTVKAGGVYKYTVRAMTSDAISGYKGTDTIVYLTTPTVKIQNAANGIKGTFSQVAGATGYIIYRSEYNSSSKAWSGWLNLGTAKQSAKSFTDKTAVSGKIYRYTVRAINGDSKSLYVASNSVVYLAQPTVKFANANAGISVKWTKSGGAQGYTVYRSEYNAKTKKWSSWKTMGTLKADRVSWTDKNVKAGTIYKYTVRAVNGNYKSTYLSTSGLVRLTQPTVKIANAKAGIVVKWSKVTGAKSYTVYRSTLVNGKWSSWSTIGTAKATVLSLTDKSVVSGTTYRYTVRAVNGKSLSSFVATTGVMFLSDPTTKIANAATGVKVSWNKVEGAQGYTIYRSQYNASTKKWSKWVSRGTAKADKSSWTDKNVTSGVYYKYTVRAVSGSFKSTYTSSGALIYLAQPTVNASKTASGISLKWNKIAGAKSYVIYRQEKIDGAWSSWSTSGTAKASATSFADKTAETGKEYRYTVRAVNGKYKSTYKASGSVVR